MVEYIIIIVMIAIGLLVIVGIFGDTLKKKWSGAVSSIDSGDKASEAQSEADVSSEDALKDLEADGM